MLTDALKELDEVVKGLDDTKPAPETLKVDPEGFIRHVTKNIAALKTDVDATRIARLKYLGECLEVAKNFDGKTPGGISLPMFKDPGQQSTTDTSGALGGPAGVNPAAKATTHGDEKIGDVDSRTRQACCVRRHVVGPRIPP